MIKSGSTRFKGLITSFWLEIRACVVQNGNRKSAMAFHLVLFFMISDDPEESNLDLQDLKS